MNSTAIYTIVLMEIHTCKELTAELILIISRSKKFFLPFCIVFQRTIDRSLMVFLKNDEKVSRSLACVLTLRLFENFYV